MRRTRRAAALAAAIGMLGTGAAGAYPVNFGTAYTPDPAHGFVVSIPQWGLDRAAFASWSLALVGLTDRTAVGVDAFWLALPGGQHGLGNVNAFGFYDLGAPWPDGQARVGALVGLPAGGFGAPQAGTFANLEWTPAAGLRHYTAIAAYTAGLGTPPRVAFDTAIEARVLPWLGFGLEVLTGLPSWEYGPSAMVGVAPSVTVYLTDALAVLTTVRTPVVPTSAAPAGGAVAGVGLTYGW